MKIFLSYPHSHSELAESLAYRLKAADYDVFWDRESLPKGEGFDIQIKNAVDEADLFICLITENSLDPGKYALTELKFASEKWPNPSGNLLPVALGEKAYHVKHPFISSVTIMKPRGNIVAEIIAEVRKLDAKDSKRYRILARYAFILLVAVLLIWVATKGMKTRASESIAVFSFNEISSEDRLTKDLFEIRFELHHYLSRLSGITLRPLREIIPKEMDGQSASAIIKELDVDFAIMGSALFKPERESTLQIELIKGKTNSAIWTDLCSFTTQGNINPSLSELVENIAEKLKVKLSPEEKSFISRRPTSNKDALQLYLEAHKISQSRDPADIARSVTLLNQAIEIDSTFALAYAELSSKIFAQGFQQIVDRKVAYPQAEALAKQALRIHDQVYVAHSVLATIEELVKGNKDSADSLYQKAIDINSNDATAFRHYSLFKKRNSQYEEAEVLARRSIDIDPESDIANRNFVDILIYNRKYNAALEHIKNFVGNETEREKQFWGYYGDIYSRVGDLKTAVVYYEKRIVDQPNVAGELGYCYGNLGQINEALNTLKKIPPGQYQDTNIAMVFAGLSAKDESYIDSTHKYLDLSLHQGVGLNVICDHPFFSKYQAKYCK